MNDTELEQLNERITDIADMDETFQIEGLENTGKVIPYLGWYWRDVYANDISLGYHKDRVWVMQNNKWDYPEYRCTAGECATIIEHLANIASEPTQEKLQAFYDYLQTYKSRRWISFEAYDES